MRDAEPQLTTTCDLCGGSLIAFEIVVGLPIRWTHGDDNDFPTNHIPIPANESGD